MKEMKRQRQKRRRRIDVVEVRSDFTTSKYYALRNDSGTYSVFNAQYRYLDECRDIKELINKLNDVLPLKWRARTRRMYEELFVR